MRWVESLLNNKKSVVSTDSNQNFGNMLPIKPEDSKEESTENDPETEEREKEKTSLKFDEFIDLIKDSWKEKEQAENYLVHSFSMFDRKKKGYIDKNDLKEVFSILGENVGEDEVNTMIKIAGVKSNDKINFKEFCDFFYKL